MFVTKVRSLDVRHFDFYSQALAKIERGFSRDLDDVRQMVRRKLVDPEKLTTFASEILPELIRYPAIDPNSFLGAVKVFVESVTED